MGQYKMREYLNSTYYLGPINKHEKWDNIKWEYI
jgi:hypothetical protein